MKFPSFGYVAPQTTSEAIDALGSEEEARPIAGGQSLLPLMAFRLSYPTVLVDLGSVDGLSGLSSENGRIRIGAMTTQAEVERSPEVRTAAPLLTAAISHVAHPVIRNAGTVGGSVAHADPAAEIPVALVALDAVINVEGPDGSRSVPAREFFLDIFTTALGPSELVVSLDVPSDRSRWGFTELSRRPGDFALAMAAVRLSMDGDRCNDATVVLGAVDSTPILSHGAGEVLAGSVIDDNAAGEAARAATDGLSPPGDIHGSGEYRKQVAGVLVKRAIANALSQNNGSVAS
jgi:aerobic carbon-monoxide dehydrogenase medium subunit